MRDKLGTPGFCILKTHKCRDRPVANDFQGGTIFVQAACIPALGGVERKGSRLELTPPSVGGSVRRPHAPPRWGRFFKRRRPGANQPACYHFCYPTPEYRPGLEGISGLEAYPKLEPNKINRFGIGIKAH